MEISKTLDGVQITLKADALDKLVSSGVKRFTIDTDSMTDFGFTLDALKKLNQQTSGDILLKVRKTIVSSREAKAAIGNRPVYDISLWEVKGGKETKLTDMTGVKISIAIPYTLAKNEQTGNLYAVYVDGNGKVQWITKSSYDADQKAVIFEAIQMGVYGVGCDKRLPAFTDIGDHWAKEAVKSMQQAGVLAGQMGNPFDPKGNAARAEAAAVLHRFVEIVIDPQTASGWVQNDSGEWSYYKDGEPVKGWFANDQKWYWMDKTTGKMFSGGWKQIEGKWYYFCADGSMAVSTKVDGYEAGTDGARK